MCDQDHFETTERLRSQGLGDAPPVRRARSAPAWPWCCRRSPTPSRSPTDVTIKTPDGTCDAYFVHPATGTGAGVLIWPDIFGLRPAFRAMGKRLAENGYSVLVVNPFYRDAEGADRREGRRHADPGAAAARAGAQRDDAHDRRQGVHRLARSAAVGGQEPQDRHAGLLHGRPDGVPHGGRGARSRRRGRVVPRRRPGDRIAEQPAPAGRRRPRRSSSSRSPPTTTCARRRRRTS